MLEVLRCITQNSNNFYTLLRLRGIHWSKALFSTCLVWQWGSKNHVSRHSHRGNEKAGKPSF